MALARHFNWTDRRPIGRLQLSFAEWMGSANPGGWINPDLKGYATWAINSLKAINAQAAVFWDLEPATDPKYRGCPERVSDYALAVIKLVRAAGFRIGCTIRWENFDEAGAPIGGTKEGFENAYRRVFYARTALKATLFYFDSNIYQDGTDRGLTTEHFQFLRRAFPDCLFMPEHGGADIHQWTARYRELRGGFSSTPADVRQQVSGAFSVIFVDEGKPREHFDELVAAVKAGDVLLTNGWMYQDDQKAVVEIIKAAA